MYTFPYQKKTIEEGAIADPKVALNLKTIVGFMPITFLVDSGADVTTLPLHSHAGFFGFQKNPRERIILGGVEGRGIGGYPYKLLVKLGREEFPLRCYFIESNTDPLLGRLDFWDKFSITFDNRSLKTIISPL